MAKLQHQIVIAGVGLGGGSTLKHGNYSYSLATPVPSHTISKQIFTPSAMFHF